MTINKQLCLPPSVTGEVYCFPRRQLLFIFDRRVIKYLKGLWEYIPKSIPSVCLYHDLQTNRGNMFFYLKCLCYTSMDSSQRALQSNRSFFQIYFWINCRNPKIFKQIARQEYWPKCKVVYQWICLYKLYKLESFLSNFELLAKNRKIINE